MESFSTEPHSEVTERQLLQSVVAVARHVYGAAASSVFVVSPDTGDLTFAAVAGAGQQSLVGRRFPAGTGIAGWVAASCQTLVVDNVAETDRFARDAAASTGYLPASILAAPLIAGSECIGVLEVLDRRTAPQGPGFSALAGGSAAGSGTAGPGFSALAGGSAAGSGERSRELDDMELLGLLAGQAALGLALLRRRSRTPAAPRMGSLVAKLSEHAATDSYDPLAVALLRVSLDLLERKSALDDAR